LTANAAKVGIKEYGEYFNPKYAIVGSTIA
jgi:hypothetical protein